jgi:hypothetical protein
MNEKLMFRKTLGALAIVGASLFLAERASAEYINNFDSLNDLSGWVTPNNEEVFYENFEGDGVLEYVWLE